MKLSGLVGVRRGKRCITTKPSASAATPLDLVNCEFMASRPNQLWVADITYVARWSGIVYVAFVVDVFSRYIVGWQVLKHMKTDLIPDAVEQALWARGKPNGDRFAQTYGKYVMKSLMQTEGVDKLNSVVAYHAFHEEVMANVHQQYASIHES